MMIGRPVARRISRTAISTASVPFSAMSTRVQRGGDNSIRRSASGATYSLVKAWVSSLP